MQTLMPTEPVALDKCEAFAHGLDHSEGIAVTTAGDIYVGGEAGQIYRIVDDAPQEVANVKGFLLGLAADAEGRIYAIDNVAKKVWRYDPRNNVTDTFIGPPEAKIKVPNWGAFDAAGNYYLTNSGDWMQGNGCIWVVRPGKKVELWSEEFAGVSERLLPVGGRSKPDRGGERSGGDRRDSDRPGRQGGKAAGTLRARRRRSGRRRLRH